LYKTRAEEAKALFKSFLKVPLDDATIDTFVKNAHGLKVLRGKKWGTLDSDPAALGSFIFNVFSAVLNCYIPANAVSKAPKQTAIHLALSALTALTVRQPGLLRKPTLSFR
jgi:amyloid beta precursor protein binding protein 1